MLSKNKIKLINSLSQKKFRDETGLFVAEGTKLVTDLSACFQCVWLIATREWQTLHIPLMAEELIEASEEELCKISNQKSSQGVFAVFRKSTHLIDFQKLKTKLTLVLDDIQDPGNLGTIIRIADWFGIRDIVCSMHSADVYNPKTVQATMGALGRVHVYYVELAGFLSSCADAEIPVYGTFLDGKDIYQQELSQEGVIVMGNEGNGISPHIENFISSRLFIPSYPAGQPTSESLNVGVATALVCGEFRRRVHL